MKWIIIILIITSLLAINVANAWESKLIEVENETISITPTINICENTTKVFKIQRENYSENSSGLEINYLQKTITDKIINTNITKTINKYTNANTGKYEIKNNGNASIIFEIKNQSLKWEFLVDCFTENTTTNNSINEPEINSTNNKTISINETNNNQTQVNQTIKENQTIEVNNSENNTEEEIDCPNKFEIITNKDIFEPGEKIYMNFFLDKWISNYEITYHIELIDGKIVKNEYVTTNNKTKTYTVKKSEQKEQAHKIIAKIDSECESLESEKIVVVKNQIEEEIQEEKEKTDIEIEGKIENNELEIIIEAKKGNTAKTVVKIFFEDENDKKIREDIKFYLKDKYSEVKLIIKEEVENEDLVNVYVEGLGIYKEIELENTDFKKTEKKEEIEEIKEQKTAENKEIKKTATKKDIKLKEVPAKINAKKDPVKIEAKNKTNTNNISNILFVISIVSIIGIGFTIYFKKHNS